MIYLPSTTFSLHNQPLETLQRNCPAPRVEVVRLILRSGAEMALHLATAVIKFSAVVLRVNCKITLQESRAHLSRAARLGLAVIASTAGLAKPELAVRAFTKLSLVEPKTPWHKGLLSKTVSIAKRALPLVAAAAVGAAVAVYLMNYRKGVQVVAEVAQDGVNTFFSSLPFKLGLTVVSLVYNQMVLRRIAQDVQIQISNINNAILDANRINAQLRAAMESQVTLNRITEVHQDRFPQTELCMKLNDGMWNFELLLNGRSMTMQEMRDMWQQADLDSASNADVEMPVLDFIRLSRGPITPSSLSNLSCSSSVASVEELPLRPVAIDDLLRFQGKFFPGMQLQVQRSAEGALLNWQILRNGVNVPFSVIQTAVSGTLQAYMRSASSLPRQPTLTRVDPEPAPLV